MKPLIPVIVVRCLCLFVIWTFVCLTEVAAQIAIRKGWYKP